MLVCVYVLCEFVLIFRIGLAPGCMAPACDLGRKGHTGTLVGPGDLGSCRVGNFWIFPLLGPGGMYILE